MTRRPLRAAVVGVGRMGANHARVAADLPGVELVAVADTNGRNARAVARRHRVAAYTSIETLLDREQLDVVAVAVPTERHIEVATVALRAGTHVLLEKPIAGDLRGAERLLRIAEESDRHIFVGHVERFNPAIQELARRLRRNDAGRVRKVHARRLSPFPARVQDAGVLIDLGTHDLDVMRFLLRMEARSVWAVARRHAHPRHDDLVLATIEFPDDTVGLLELDWLTPTKVRELSVLGDRGMFTVNYLTQELIFYENALVRGKWDALGNLVYGVGEGKIIRYPIAHVEPLRAEWIAFIGAVRGHRNSSVSGTDAVRTLELAMAIQRSARSGRVVAMPRR